MTDFKMGDRVLRKGEPGTIAGVRGYGHPAWAYAIPDETYLVVLDSAPDDVYYARPGDIEVIEEEA